MRSAMQTAGLGVLVICLCAVQLPMAVASDVTLLREDFEVFPPPNWEVLRSDSSGVGWQEILGTEPACDWGEHSGVNAAWHDDEDDPGMQDDWLITPTLAIPAEATAATLTFWERNCHVAGYYYYHALLYSQDGGEWQEVAEFDERRDEWTLVTVDATAAAGSNLRFAWRYQGAWATEWFIDDVVFVVAVPEAAADGPAELLPRRLMLAEPYPNPFNNTAVIPLELPQSGLVELAIYDMLGRRVVTLTEPIPLAAGSHRFYWQARDAAAGLYFVRLTSGDAVQTKKLLLVK